MTSLATSLRSLPKRQAGGANGVVTFDRLLDAYHKPSFKLPAVRCPGYKLTERGQSGHSFFRLRWRSIRSQLRQLFRRIAAHVTEAALQYRPKSPNLYCTFAASCLNSKVAGQCLIDFQLSMCIGKTPLNCRCSLEGRPLNP